MQRNSAADPADADKMNQQTLSALAEDTEAIKAKFRELAKDRTTPSGRVYIATEERLKSLAEKWQHPKITQDLVFKSVMIRNKKCCKRFLEALLRIRIAEIEFIESEAVNQPDPADPQTRFDLLVTDTEGRCYDIEMQARSDGSCRDLWDRARRYFNTLERRQYQLLGGGKDQRRRAGTYVVFLCGFDPVGQERRVYRYPWRGPHKECTTETWAYEDHIVFLNADGRHGKVSTELREFADFMRSGRAAGKLTQMMAATIEELKENGEKLMTDILNNELYQYDLAEAEYRGEARGEIRGEIRGGKNERNRLRELQGILIKTNQQDVALRLHSMSDDEIESLYRKYGLKSDPA